MYNNINDLSVASAIKRISMAAVGAIGLTLGTAGVGHAIITYGNPDDYIAQPGSMFSGVGLLGVHDGENGYKDLCTGSLLNGGSYVLTAAHCVTDEEKGSFNSSLIGKYTIDFNPGTAEQVTLPISNFYAEPQWFDSEGNLFRGNDIAVLQLAKPAPSNIAQYGIYRNQDEVGQTFAKVGAGYNGNGAKGQQEGNFDGKLRYGQNQYDSPNDIFKNAGITIKDDNGKPVNPFADTISGSQLVYGFTDGDPDHDPFQVHFGFSSNQLGSSEVFPAQGDSGGPGFIGDLIASVTSYGISDYLFNFPDGKHSDIDQKPDSTFGEFNSDTRVSSYQNFVDNVLAGNITPTNVPEPSTTWGLFTLGGLGAFSLLRRKKF